ncbi:MAG TPA: hypothetical protein VMV54_05085 [Acidocella sp.]|nr:hypothetical protein [Acidocella sp.]
MRSHSPNRQSGSMLLETMVALLIFSLGILAIVGMQATSIKLAGDAKYRTDASLLANQLIGEMWVGDRSVTALQTNFSSPGGAAYMSWLSGVQAALPGAGANPPTVTVNGNNLVTVRVFWKAPGDGASAAAHAQTVIAQIK